MDAPQSSGESSRTSGASSLEAASSSSASAAASPASKNASFWPLIYSGSVKNLLGPVRLGQASGVIFEYTDAYSVFDWGRMPDALARKGSALATLAADWFEKLEKPETWREFSKSPVAFALRKGNRFGSAFNELGEKLQNEGLRTHYVGILPHVEPGSSATVRPHQLAELASAPQHFVARQVSAVRPESTTVLGRAVPDYAKTRVSAAPRLAPLEVVFRYSLPSGSSLIERAGKNPDYLSSIGFSGWTVEPGAKWDFPVLELFTKLESTDRLISLTEALAISGISGAQLNVLLLKTAWVSGMIKWFCEQQGLELADGKLEWGVSESGEIFLVDAIGPDELRILKDGVQLSKEFLRDFYRQTPWYDALNQAKEQAKAQGTSDWKKFVSVPAPHLSPRHLELATQLYLALTNELTGRKWFEDVPALSEIVSGIRSLSEKV